MIEDIRKIEENLNSINNSENPFLAYHAARALEFDLLEYLRESKIVDNKTMEHIQVMKSLAKLTGCTNEIDNLEKELLSISIQIQNKMRSLLRQTQESITVIQQKIRKEFAEFSGEIYSATESFALH